MTFCVFPFIGLNLGEGSVKPCCHYEDKSDYLFENDFVKNPMDHLDNGNFYKIREKMLKNEKVKGCERCYFKESMGVRSRRTAYNKKYKDTVNDSFPNKYDRLRFLHITLDSICNFECRMCSSEFSSKLYKRDVFLGGPAGSWNEAKKPKHTNISFLRGIDLSHLDVLHLQGGEPFMSPNLETMIDIVEEQVDLNNVKLEFNTNASVLPNDRIKEKLLKFKSIKMEVSVESINKVNDYIRYRGKLEDVLQNAKEFKEWDNVKLEFNTNINVYNADTMPETHERLSEIAYHFYDFTSYASCVLNHAPSEYQDWLCDRVKGTKFEKYYRNFFKNVEYSDKKWNEFIEETKKLDVFYGIKLSDYHPDLAEFLDI